MSLLDGRFDSDAAKRLRQLKRKLVYDLFFQQGVFGKPSMTCALAGTSRRFASSLPADLIALLRLLGGFTLMRWETR